ncbi:MAG: PIN domain-containing protein [Ruminococcus flavefaciens]|nr:PIN domain-containing protein [Ruminococcus flavefaciens]
MAIKVFLDTNIYEGANFSFYNKQFSKLKELIEEESVELLYNEIVYKEVYQHIRENLTKAVSEYNQVIEVNRAFAPFRMDDKWGDKISQIKADDMICELCKQWGDYIADTYATKISISGVDVNKIVDQYFNKQFPFENKKPTEFKDAICVDSVIQYYDTISDDKIYVVTADKGFRKSFKERDKFVTFYDLNGFLNFAISQTEHLAVEIEKAFESGELDGFISSTLDDQLYSKGSIYVEDVYDGIDDLLNVETQTIEFGYIHELDEECALVVANASVNVDVEYTVRDEDNSYYDREDDRYYWENFVTYRATFCMDLEIEVSIAIEKDGKDLSVSVEADGVNVNPNLYLHKSDITESEIIHNTIDDYDEDPFDANARYCPDCGCKMDYENDMGAFCIKCAPNH